MNRNQSNENEKFIEIYRETINKSGLGNSLSYIVDQLSIFEKGDIYDVKVKNIIKKMLYIPYYEQGKRIDNLRKFQLLKEKLKFFNNQLEEADIIRRLNALKTPTTPFPKINKYSDLNKHSDLNKLYEFK